MKLITKKIEQKLLSKPMYSTDGNPIKDVLVKFFNPCGIGTWYVFEAEKNESTNDWEFFGLVDLHDKELGYFTLNELQSIKLPFGLSIERDLYFNNKKYNCETGEFE